MTLLSQSALLAAVIAGTLAVLHGLRWGVSPLHRLFSVACVALMLRYATTFVGSAFQAGPSWDVASVVFGLSVPWTVLRFFQRFLGVEGDSRANRWVGGSAIVLILLALMPIGRHPWLRGLDLIYAFATLYGCAFLIWHRLMAEESRIQATRSKYLLIGLLISVTLSLLDYLPHLDVPFLTVGNAVTGAYLYFLSQAILRHRLLDLNELLGKGVVLSLLAVVLATIYTLLVVWVGEQPSLMVFNSLVASIVILALFEPLRSLAESRVAPLLFREKFEFERRLEALRREVTGQVELGEVGRIVVRRLGRSRRVTHTSLYLLDTDGVTYRRRAFLGIEPAAELEMGIYRPMLERLHRERVLLIEDLEQRVREAEQRDLLEERAEVASLRECIECMHTLFAGVLIPLPGHGAPIGLLCLNDDRLREAYSYDEIAGMVEVARQLAITVESSRLYEGLRQRDRLAVVGEMAAGLAHEIRNPLGAIKGAAQVLESASSEGPPDLQLLSVIVEEVNRLNDVVSRFLDYARPLTITPEPTDLGILAQKTFALLEGSPVAEGVELELELQDELPEVLGDARMLQNVLLNLGLNGLEACVEGGRVQVTIERQLGRPPRVPRSSGDGKQDWVVMRVEDSGAGMTSEVLGNLFIPFYTTKEQGTGMGLAICDRIVRELGGVIDVRSRPARGSTFSVYLRAVPQKPTIEAGKGGAGVSAGASEALVFPDEAKATDGSGR